MNQKTNAQRADAAADNSSQLTLPSVPALPVTSPFASLALPDNVALPTNKLSLDQMRLPQNFGAVAGVQKIITNIPARKPGNQAFFRVRPGAEWRVQLAILQLKDDGENYLVLPQMFGELAQEARPKLLYAAITRDGTPFVWPVNLPGEDGRLDTWSQSAHEAAKHAESSWIRLVANRSSGAYDILQATGELAAPEWPEFSLVELLNLAFKDKVIDSPEHPIVRRLRGEL